MWNKVNDVDDYVFEDKDFLVRFLYFILENPTRIKIQKTLYLLYAYYGATYGQLTRSEGDDEFSDQRYPKELFAAKFEAWRYGPVEYEVYKKDVEGFYEENPLNLQEIEIFYDSPEKKNVKDFIKNISDQTDQIDDFSLVDLTHQDRSWSNVYVEGENHIEMSNDEIINEYIERYDG